jgi:electron transfer flavoprotein beta subunit
MATGPDELVSLDDPAFDRERLDPAATATLLAAAIRRIGLPDLILAGRQASDTNAGLVGLALAHQLGIPAVTLARKIELVGDRLRVERVLADGYEVVTLGLPALVTVSHEVGELRYPRMQDIKAAKEKPQQKLGLEDLGETMPEIQAVLRELRAPVRERRCVLVEADSPSEAGERLAARLIEDRVI